MYGETKTAETFNPDTLNVSLRAMYNRHLKYIEQMLGDIVILTGHSITEEALDRVRKSHIEFRQRTILEIIQTQNDERDRNI
jgi:hypothetical protein